MFAVRFQQRLYLWIVQWCMSDKRVRITRLISQRLQPARFLKRIVRMRARFYMNYFLYRYILRIDKIIVQAIGGGNRLNTTIWSVGREWRHQPGIANIFQIPQMHMDINNTRNFHKNSPYNFYNFAYGLLVCCSAAGRIKYRSCVK